MPDPGFGFSEIETAKLHGGWSVWRRLSAVERAQLMAHEQHKAMRDHYYFDQHKTGDDPDRRRPQPMPHELMRERFWGGKRKD